MSKQFKKYNILHFVVMAYLIAAFTWWAILLYRKNEENYQLQQQLIEANVLTAQQSIQKKYETQKRMILSEGIFFGLSILLGLLFINRAFRKELHLNQTLNDFLLSVTHELKTPIASLKLVNHTLKRTGLPQDKKADLLNTGWEETIRLESLVNNILTAAQIDSSYKFNFEEINIDELIKQRFHRFQKLFPKRIIAYKETSSLVGKVDLESFTKVVDNLIHNALKYSPENEPVNVKLNRTAHHYNLQVADHGKGISPSEKEKIWEKFYRIGNEETRETQGTGLGLWIVKQIVTAHKGKIDLKDNNTKGSIFTISLPLST